MVILELVLGFPVYMAYKTRLTREVGGMTQQSPLQTGLLGCTTRESAKILKLVNQHFSGQNYIERIL